MLSVVKPRVCPLCGEIYYLSDGRYKYCSDECAAKAQLKRADKTFRKRCGATVVKRHETRLELERQQFLDDYWRRCTEDFKRNCKSNDRVAGAIPNWLGRILKDRRRRREQKRPV